MMSATLNTGEYTMHNKNNIMPNFGVSFILLSKLQSNTAELCLPSSIQLAGHAADYSSIHSSCSPSGGMKWLNGGRRWGIGGKSENLKNHHIQIYVQRGATGSVTSSVDVYY